jgi:F-type H+-transporting ATPase subunit a
MISFFAASQGVPLAAEPVFNIGSFAVTNSMLFGVITAMLVVVIFMVARVRTKTRPVSAFAFAIEQVVDFVLNIAEQNFGDRKKALRHLPVLLTLFTFILFANLSGLIPGVGTVLIMTEDGQIPLLRAFTTDLNGTLALAILSIGLVQFYAIKELGVMGRLRHFFTDKPWNPMNFFLGLVEVLTELIRILTLSMRLFGVIYAGEVLIHVIGSISGSFGWAATLPIYLLEVFFSAIQAYIFVMLTTVYLSTATSHEEIHQDLAESEHSPVVAPDAHRVPAGSEAK